MEKFEKQPSVPPSEQRPDIGPIEHMPETTVAEIRSKKNAFNDLILKLDNLIPQIHPRNESGENADQIDNADEAAQDGQDFDLLKRDMDHAREEMVRLGDKEELELKKAA
jgi:hypothetical protein